MGRVRVLHVAVWYPTADRPGWGSFVRSHVLAAGREATTVGVVHLDETAGPSAATRSDDAGVPVVRIPYRRGRTGPVGYPLRAWTASRTIATAARRGRAGLIHAHVLEAAVPAWLAARSMGLPLVVSEHFSAYARGELTRLQVLKARVVLPRADRILVVSRSLGEDLGRIAGVTAEVVPNVVDPESFHPGAPDAVRPGTLLFAGRLEPVKRVDVLLEALAELRSVDTIWEVRIAGEGSLAGALRSQARRLGVAEAVTFLGRLDRAALAQELRTAATAVVPSAWETNSVFALEAMMSGTPVVASDVGGLREIVTPAHGRRVPPGDPPALAAALSALGPAPERLEAATVSALAERHAPAAVGRELLRVYRECTGG